MSSRLFQEVRERARPLLLDLLQLLGAGGYRVVRNPRGDGDRMMGQLIDVVGAELKRATEKRPTPTEVARAKAQLKAGLLMGLESSSARAEQMARQMLLIDRVLIERRADGQGRCRDGRRCARLRRQASGQPRLGFRRRAGPALAQVRRAAQRTWCESLALRGEQDDGIPDDRPPVTTAP